MSAARRFLPTDAKDLLRSLVPLGLLVVAAVIGGALVRWLILGILVAGTIVAAQRRAPVRWAWAAAVPTAAWLIVPLLGLDLGTSWIAGCAALGNAIGTTALASALVVLGTSIGLAVALGADRTTLFVRLPRRSQWAWMVIGIAGGLVIGSMVLPVVAYGRPPASILSIDLRPEAIVQAVLFGLGTTIAAEVALRGALLGWSARVVGVAIAVVGQAIVTAVAWPLLVDAGPAASLLWGGYGLLTGILTIQTRSLAVSAATTFGLSVALYLQIACQG